MNPYNRQFLDETFGAPLPHEVISNRIARLKDELTRPNIGDWMDNTEHDLAAIRDAIGRYELLLMPGVDGDGI